MVDILQNKFTTSSKKKSYTQFRSDVQIKQILRAARKFYDIKMEKQLGFKKKVVKGQMPKSFLLYTDQFATSHLDPSLLELFDHVSTKSISNHLAGLISHNRLKLEVN